MKLNFYSSCVNWPRDDVNTDGGLCSMIDRQVSVTRQTFMRHVNKHDREVLERHFGYAPHDPGASLTMKRDFAVGYAKSLLHGKIVYFINHSAIEYVFA